MPRRVVLALVADIHCRPEIIDDLREGLAPVNDDADILVMCGDLCNMGRVEEAKALTGVLRTVQIPMVAVLGNHDYHSGHVTEVIAILENAGIHVLRGTGCTINIDGTTVGFAGAKGFCGGYGTYCLTPFGEQGIKRFINETHDDANNLDACLQTLDTDYRVVLLHYAPIKETLFGEPPELYPFLGSSILAEPIDKHGCDLVVHGHAHNGVEEGETAGGILVKNVAMPVIKRSYVLHELDANARTRKGKR
jgi:Icc-related predicted phosphoesterase